jgi:F-box protein 11
MEKHQPIAFMSYAIDDDEHDGGNLTRFCERLSGEVQMQTGDEFVIFQDRKHILWGQNWRARIEESLDGAAFLIPIITPSFFVSPYCCDELERFLERERQLDQQVGIGNCYSSVCRLA